MRVGAAVAGEPFREGGREYTITCSIGLRIIDDQIADATTALSDADKACYLAKQQGGNQVVLSQRSLRTVNESSG